MKFLLLIFLVVLAFTQSKRNWNDNYNRKSLNIIRSNSTKLLTKSSENSCNTWLPYNIYLAGQVAASRFFNGILLTSPSTIVLQDIQFDLELKPRVRNTVGPTELTALSVLLVIARSGFTPTANDITPVRPNNLPWNGQAGVLPSVSPFNFQPEGPLYRFPNDVVFAKVFNVENGANERPVYKINYQSLCDPTIDKIQLNSGDRIMFLISHGSNDVTMNSDGFVFNGNFNWVQA
jgi:hypothetical protein